MDRCQDLSVKSPRVISSLKCMLEINARWRNRGRTRSELQPTLFQVRRYSVNRTLKNVTSRQNSHCGQRNGAKTHYQFSRKSNQMRTKHLEVKTRNCAHQIGLSAHCVLTESLNILVTSQIREKKHSLEQLFNMRSSAKHKQQKNGKHWCERQHNQLTN